MMKFIEVEDRGVRSEGTFVENDTLIALAKGRWSEFSEMPFDMAIEDGNVMITKNDVGIISSISFLDHSWDCYTIELPSVEIPEKTPLSAVLEIAMQAGLKVSEISAEAISKTLNQPENMGVILQAAMLVNEGVEIVNNQGINLEKCLAEKIITAYDLEDLGHESFANPYGESNELLSKVFSIETIDKMFATKKRVFASNFSCMEKVCKEIDVSPKDVTPQIALQKYLGISKEEANTLVAALHAIRMVREGEDVIDGLDLSNLNDKLSERDLFNLGEKLFFEGYDGETEQRFAYDLLMQLGLDIPEN